MGTQVNGGIFCIESKWRTGEGVSARPMLEMLKQYYDINYELRTANENKTLKRHLREWSKVDVYYAILYLWYHGSPGGVSPDPDGYGELTLDEIANVLDGVGENCIIHFGACSVMDVDRHTRKRFLDSTGVSAVSGYKQDVYWIESLAFEMLYMSCLQNVLGEWEETHITPRIMAEVWAKLQEKPYRQFVKRLGFNMWRA